MRMLLDLLSSPLFPLFFSAQENAISYYDSKADSDYVSTVRTLPALQPACLNKPPPPRTPPALPAHPLPCNLPPAPPLPPIPSLVRPPGCPCVLVRWCLFTES